jgi:hypothetical protein
MGETCRSEKKQKTRRFQRWNQVLESCKWRSYAERKPGSLIGKLWRWHTKWRPGWKAYQEELAKREEGSGK